jgi:chitinase
MLEDHVDLAGVNVLAMDYGNSLLPGQTMLNGSESALTQTERQLGILYEEAHIPLSNSTLWSKIGATPMIGQNDISNEVFTMTDAKGLNSFAKSHGVGRMSMWSANRDITCGSNYVDTKIVSTSCSGVNEGNQTFASTLSTGFNGSISLSAGLVTKADLTQIASTPDNPATSPYPIWSATAAYLEGTKVVWKHNIYEAKWWTQGDVPNDPVLQTWQTPWELIGPVLPGEKPVPQPTLPSGTYPSWSGTNIYNTGQCVLFNNVPYQAKWWNQGDSPAAATSDPDGSPWTPLTETQISSILADNGSPCTSASSTSSQ